MVPTTMSSAWDRIHARPPLLALFGSTWQAGPPSDTPQPVPLFCDRRIPPASAAVTSVRQRSAQLNGAARPITCWNSRNSKGSQCSLREASDGLDQPGCNNGQHQRCWTTASMNLMDGWPVDVGALHFQQLDHAIHDRAFMNSQPGVTCEPPT